MKDKKMDEHKISGYFDDGSEFDGTLRFRGSFRIDGFFKGRIESDAMLIIGDKGKVDAEIVVNHVVINGEVRGNIKAAERVEINSQGRVYGTVSTPKLIVEEGAYLEATCQTCDQPPGPVEETKLKS
jgi:cytoskeletal protein CcmA (bactofilin family)